LYADDILLIDPSLSRTTTACVCTWTWLARHVHQHLHVTLSACSSRSNNLRQHCVGITSLTGWWLKAISHSAYFMQARSF